MENEKSPRMSYQIPPKPEKKTSYKQGNGKKSKHYRSHSSRNGKSFNYSNEPYSKADRTPVDLSDIVLTEEEKKDLHLTNLRSKDIHSLTNLAHKLKVENPGIMARKDIVFEILKIAGQ